MIKITERKPEGIIDRLVAPEEASSELLKAMKQYAEVDLKISDSCKVTRISVIFGRQKSDRCGHNSASIF